MRLQMLVVMAMWFLSLAAQGENLLENPGFEYEGSWTAQDSASLRNTWRSHDGGQFNAGILGLWATRGANGFVEQAGIPVLAGKRYLFQAWLWADLGWKPAEQYMSILFQDSTGQVLKEEKIPLPSLHPVWTPVKCAAYAPMGAVTASVRIGARGVSFHGALTIDDCSFANEDIPE
ncbi:MAG: hypothetical protein KA248_09300 [Kiritimatiellae bacterium]|nr:hypothetical protein [Kiritimatiellia bacterium]